MPPHVPEGPTGERVRLTGRRLSAILFSDIVGYTALMQENERRARRDRGRQRSALQTHVARNDGRILQYYGDGALCVFDSAVAAVVAAIAVQRELNAEPRVALRAGIHTGDVVYDDEGVFGDGVNVASRVQSLGSPGSVLISEKVYDEIKNQPDLEAVSLGAFDLKNVRRPLEVYAIMADDLAVPAADSLPTRAGRTLRSVAVLPFANLSADPDNEFFSDGITEELINVLARVNGLQVTARTSCFALKGRQADVREIAATLGVDTVLEGSVRRSGSRVRIAAQLVDAANGYHIFSESFDRTLDDLFEAQDDIARCITRAIEDRLTPDRRGTPTTTRTSTEAHAWYLRGLHEYGRWTPEGYRHAIDMFERALAVDDTFAKGYLGLALAHHEIARWAQADVQHSWQAAAAAASRALELDPTLGEAQVVLAMERMLRAWDFDGAYERLQKALSLSPGSARVHAAYSLYLCMIGDFERACAEVDAAGQLDPLSLPVMLMRAEMRIHAGRPREAIEITDRILEEEPTFRAAIKRRGLAYAMVGEAQKAAEQLDRVVAITGDEHRWLAERGFVYTLLDRHADARRNLHLLHEKADANPEQPLDLDFWFLLASLGERDHAAEHLERAILDRISLIPFLINSRFWRMSTNDPRTEEVLARHGLDRLRSGSSGSERTDPAGGGTADAESSETSEPG